MWSLWLAAKFPTISSSIKEWRIPRRLKSTQVGRYISEHSVLPRLHFVLIGVISVKDYGACNRLPMSDEWLEGVKVLIKDSDVKVLARIQHRKRCVDRGWKKMRWGQFITYRKCCWSLCLVAWEVVTWGLAWVRGRVIGGNLIILEKWGDLEEAGFTYWELWAAHRSPLGEVLMKRGHDENEEKVQTFRHRHAGRGEGGRGRWYGWLTLLCASHHYKSSYRHLSFSCSLMHITLCLI